MDTEKATWLVENADKIDAFFILIVLLMLASWVIYHLYKNEQKCAASRLVDEKDRGEIKQNLGRLEGKVETMESTMASLHTQALELVAKSKE